MFAFLAKLLFAEPMPSPIFSEVLAHNKGRSS